MVCENAENDPCSAQCGGDTGAGGELGHELASCSSGTRARGRRQLDPKVAAAKGVGEGMEDKLQAASGTLWQRPYVDLFKLVELNASSWGKVAKEGNVKMVLDKGIGKNVLRVTGTTMTGNSVQIPSGKSSLGLTGQYAYLQLKPMGVKLFTVHLEVLAKDNFVTRITISNMFRTFKRKGSVIQVPVDLGDMWFTIALDIPQLLRKMKDNVHSDEFWCIKALTVCPNVYVRNLYTSETAYSLDGEIVGTENLPKPLHMTRLSQHRRVEEFLWLPANPKRNEERVLQNITSINTSTVPSRSLAAGGGGLPVRGSSPKSRTRGQIKDAQKQQLGKPLASTSFARKQRAGSIASSTASAIRASRDMSGGFKLRPDPILEMRTLLGFSSEPQEAAQPLWSVDGQSVLYANACNIVIGRLAHIKLKQTVLFGHTDHVTSLAIDPDGTLLASSQRGKSPVIRVWDLKTHKCIALIAACAGGELSSLDFSADSNFLCAVGKDEQNRTQLCVWDLTGVYAGRASSGPGGPSNNKERFSLVAKQTSEFDIVKLKFSPYDSCQLVSCGNENIRFWRVRNKHLPGTPVVLKEYAREVTFTDLAFESSFGAGAAANASLDKRVFVASDAGSIVCVHYERRTMMHIFRLHDGPIQSIAVNEGFCVTASSDEYVRVWPLDFDDFFMEAKHESAVSGVAISPDGLKVVVSTKAGALGVLDVTNHSHQNLITTHGSAISCVAFRPTLENGGDQCEMATCAADGTLRVWSVPSCEQLYEMHSTASSGESCCLTYHPDPAKHLLFCGYSSGIVLVFDVPSVSAIWEFKQHVGPVQGLCVSPDGLMSFSLGKDGNLCLYDNTNSFQPVKMLPVASNALSDQSSAPRGRQQSSPANVASLVSAKGMAIDSSGKLLACIVPQEPHEIVLFQISPPDNESEQPFADVVVSLRISRRSRFASDFVKVMFSPDASELVATTNDNRICRYRLLSSPTQGWEATLVRDVHSYHPEFVSALAVSPQHGSFLATCGSDNMVQVWDYKMRGVLSGVPSMQRFLGHSATVSDLAFSPNTKFLVSVSVDQTIVLWDFLGKETVDDDLEDVVKANRKSDASAEAMERSEQMRASAVAQLPFVHLNGKGDQTPREPRPEPTGTQTRLLGPSARHGANLAWGPSSGLFVYANGPTLVQEDLSSCEQEQKHVHHAPISVVRLSEGGELLATGAATVTSRGDHPEAPRSAEILLWTVTNGEVGQQGRHLMGHADGPVQDLAFAPSNKYLVSIGNVQDGSICVWNITYCTLAWKTTLQLNVGHSVLWPTPSLMLSLGAHSQFTLWNMAGDSESSIDRIEFEDDVITLCGSPEAPSDIHLTSAALSPSWLARSHLAETVFAIADQRGEAFVLAMPQRTVLARWQAAEAEIVSTAWCNKSIVFGVCTGIVVVWSVDKSYPEAGTLPSHVFNLESPILGMCWHAQGNDALISTRDASVWSVDVAAPNVVPITHGHSNEVLSLSWSRNYQWMATVAAHERRVRLWKAMEHVEFAGDTDVCSAPAEVCAVAFFGEQRGPQYCIVGCSDGSVSVLDVDASQVVSTRDVFHDSTPVRSIVTTQGWVIVSSARGEVQAIPSDGQTGNVEAGEIVNVLPESDDASVEIELAVSEYEAGVIAVRSSEGTVSLVECTAQKVVASALEGIHKPVGVMTFVRPKQLMYSVDGDPTLTLLGIESAETKEVRLPQGNAVCASGAFVGTDLGQVWRLDGDALVLVSSCHAGPVSVLGAVDETLVFSVSSDRVAQHILRA